MNAVDILKYGHGTFGRALQRVPDDARTISGACGSWSVKDIVAHLASHELVLVDILGSALGPVATPYLDRLLIPGANFNDDEVNDRAAMTYADVLAEYNAAHAQVMALVGQVPVEQLRQVGTLPWYGPEYALDDLLVYGYYGHKREHSAQIDMFCDRQP